MAFGMDALLRIKADVQGENNIRRLGNSLQGLEGQAKNASRSLATITDGFRGLNGLLLGIGGGFTIAKIFGDTATLESQTRSLQVLTGSAAQAADIIGQLRTFANVTPFESTELIETAKRLNAFGVQGERVVDVTKRLGDVAGATGANISELATAYGQVVAKGRLQGEELLQFQERGVALQQELQKMYGLSGKELQKALEQGRISAQAVEVAIQRLTDKGGKYANGAIAQSDTLKGKLSTLSDAFTNLAINIGKKLEPIFKFLLDRTTELINRLNSGFAGASQNIRQQIGTKRLQNAGVSNTYSDAQGNVYSTITGRLVQAGRVATTSSASPLAVPALLPGSSSSEKKPKDDSKARAERLAAAKESYYQERAALKLLQEADPVRKVELEYTERKRALLARLASEQSKALTGEEQAYVQRERSVALRKLEIEKAKEMKVAIDELQKKTYSFLDDGLFSAEGLNRITTGADQLKKVFTSPMDLTGGSMATEFQRVRVELEALLNPINQVTTAALGIGEAFSDSFAGLVNGSMTAQESLANLFKGIADSFMNMAAQMISKWIEMQILGLAQSFFPGGRGGFISNLFGSSGISAGGNLGSSFGFANGAAFAQNGIQPFAMGGIVDRPTMFRFANGGAGNLGLMGEAGPEAILPLKRGANGKLGVAGGGGDTNVTVNVDAKGTSAQGDGGRGEQLARVVAQAVQAELIRQKRPGGVLA